MAHTPDATAPAPSERCACADYVLRGGPPCTIHTKPTLAPEGAAVPLESYESAARCIEEDEKTIAALRERVRTLEEGDEQRVRDITKYVTERDKAEAEVERLKNSEAEYERGWSVERICRTFEKARADKAEAALMLVAEAGGLSVAIADAKALKARVAFLSSLIEEAPHTLKCSYSFCGQEPCDCWKAKAEVGK